jgi:hypothetical protein
MPSVSERVAAKAPLPARPVPTVAEKAGMFDQPRLTIMGGLALLALADYGAVRTGIVNGAPDGNPSYAAAAFVMTVALWALLPGYSPERRAVSRGARAVMYLALLAVHGIAAVMAFVPRRNPTAMVVVDSAGTTLALVVMVLVAVYAFWCRACPLAKGS